MPSTFQLTAKTLFGLERVLAGELESIGAQRIQLGRRLVDFNGDQEVLYRANLWCRTAIRILRPIHSFQADSEQALYAGVQSIDWSEYLEPEGSLTIDPVVYSSFTTHSLYAAQLTKDAIVDQFRERTGVRPSVDRNDPDLRINLHLNQNRATVYLDSSGDSLHKRGYRTATNQAPMNEVLAAGIIRLSRWDPDSPFADFMCGSGTLPIEAAMIARNIAPGTIRREFAYMWWKDFDSGLHERLVAEARAAQKESLDFPIVGSDLDPAVVEIAKQNARNAGVLDNIRFEVASFDTARPPAPAGTLVTNPPYDERLKVAQLGAVYRRIGDALKKNWTGYTAYLLTGNLSAAREFGLRPSRKIRLFNGPIECRLLEFELRRGEPARTRLRNFAQAVAGEPASAIADSPIAPDGRRSWQAQAEDFRNRLQRMARHWGRWARRQGITCYRLYDRDIPEIPLAIDWYEGHLHIAEYDRPHDRTELEHQAWLRSMGETAAATLNVDADKVFVKHRQRQRGPAQYERQASEGNFLVVSEGGHRFRVNLADYLDTGLFLDHRITRGIVQQEAQSKRFLNLFAYTGAFSVYAAAGGALSTTTVDMSNTYLDWARENMRLNGFDQVWHQFVRADTMTFLRNLDGRRGPPFDLIVTDPPTFSNSKKTEGIWDVQRDHVEMLNLLIANLAPGGKIFFSTNFRKFKFHESEIQGAVIREISGQTVPPDFRNKRIHRCWTLIRAS